MSIDREKLTSFLVSVKERHINNGYQGDVGYTVICIVDHILERIEAGEFDESSIDKYFGIEDDDTGYEDEC